MLKLCWVFLWPFLLYAAESPNKNQAYFVEKNLSLANKQMSFGNYEQALNYLNEIFKVEPLNAKALEVLYEIRVEQEEFLKGIGTLLNVLAQKPASFYTKIKSATALRYYFRQNKKIIIPDEKSLKSFYQLGLLHIFALNKKMQAENYEDARLHSRQATKYLYLAKHFGLDGEKIKSATQSLQQALKRYRPQAAAWRRRLREDAYLNGELEPVVDVEEKEQAGLRGELRQVDKIKQGRFTTFSVAYTFWNEKINAIQNDNTGGSEGTELGAIVRTVCLGGGIENNAKRVTWALNGCLLFGVASIAQDEEQRIQVSRAKAKVFGVMGGPAFYWHPFLNGYSLGVSFQLLSRNLNIERSSSVLVEDENLTTVGGFLEARVKAQGVLASVKFGLGPAIDFPITMIQLAYQF